MSKMEQNDDRKENIKVRFLRKLIVYTISIVLVCLVLTGVLFVRQWNLQETKEKTMAQEPETDEDLQEAKAAMTEQEILALYEKSLEKEPALESASEDETENAEETPAGEDTYEAPIDFDMLWEINPDVYAWIRIPGTEIDYPILQHETDNTYYLNYNIDGSYGYPGCIYTENLNSKDFMDNNTVIYGHNMKNGTMFAGLHKYEDMSFLKENDTVLIYTPEKEYEYTIFAAYIYDDRHLLYSFDFANEDVYASYLENIQSMRDLSANIRTDISVSAKDKIITLVTCMSKQPEKRLLVQAVLDDE